MGSVYFRRHCPEPPLLSEAESNAHDAFVHEPGCVKIIFRNVRNCLSYLPASDTDRGQAIASELFETYRDTRENIVATALHNPNLTVHTIGMYAMKPMMDYCAKYHPDEVPGMYRDALGTDFAWAVLELLDGDNDSQTLGPMTGYPSGYEFQPAGITLSQENRRQLFIPEGFAHGFCVLSESAEFLYKCTDYYAPEFERVLRWNDPALAIDWPLQAGAQPTVSERDAAGDTFADAEYYE